jgi:hypothetical protein
MDMSLLAVLVIYVGPFVGIGIVWLMRVRSARRWARRQVILIVSYWLLVFVWAVWVSLSWHYGDPTFFFRR